MARKPAQVVAASEWPQGRDEIWSKIRTLRQFTLNGLWRAVECEIPIKTIESYIQGLTKAGYLSRLKRPRRGGRFPPALYELANDVGVEAPRVRRDGTEVTQGAARDNMWRGMRMLATFSPKDLAVAASTAEVAVSEIDAKDYCKSLSKAGYLAVVTESQPGTQAVYRFVTSRNSGPKAPMIQRVKCVFDPNLGKVVWPPEMSV